MSFMVKIEEIYYMLDSLARESVGFVGMFVFLWS